MNKIRFIIFGLMFLILGGSSWANYQDRHSLEESTTNKAQHILDTMYGPYHFSVTTTVTLGRESWNVVYTERSKIKSNKKRDSSTTKYQILPGYSAIKNLSVDETVGLPFNAKVSKVPPKIQKKDVHILVSKEVSKKDVRLAEKILIENLNLDKSRGDTISFEFKKFPIHEKNINGILANLEIVKEVSEPLRSNNKLLTLELLLIGFFVWMYFYRQKKILKQGIKQKSASQMGGGSLIKKPSKAGNETFDSSSEIQSKIDMKHYFDFVTDKTIDSVKIILKREGLSSSHIAMIASYLSPVHASCLFNAYSTKDQADMIAVLTNQKIIDKELIEKLHNKIKGRLECMVGGISKLSVIFEHLKNDAKKDILKSLESNKDVFQKVRPYMLVFEDLLYLSVEDLKKVLTEVSSDLISIAMNSSDAKVQKKIESALSESARALIKQFSELKGGHLSELEIEKAQQEIVVFMLEMDRVGKIKLLNNIPGILLNTKNSSSGKT